MEKNIEKFLESIYYGEQTRNHKIPKVYYKQWITKNVFNCSNPKLKVFDKNKNKIVYIGLLDFTVENNTFVIKFGDIFLPDIVTNHFKRIIDKCDFIINGKMEYDVQSLSCYYSCSENIDIKILDNGLDAKQKFEKEILREKCYCIENGLNSFYENNFDNIINEVKDRCSNNNENIELTDNVLLNLRKLYLSFYFRSDASYSLMEECYKNSKLSEIECVNGYDVNEPKLKKELFENLRRMYLWNMMFEPLEFCNICKPIIEKLGGLKPYIHVNNSKYKFYTSELPIINNGVNTFLILTPKLLLEYAPIDDLGLKNSNVLLVDYLSEDTVIKINNDIKEHADLIIMM